MLLQLQRYNVNFVYKKGSELYIADTLSRAYVDEKPGRESDSQYEVMSLFPISSTRLEELKKATATDPVMQKLVHYTKTGWPQKYKNVPLELRDYFSIRDELMVDSNLLMRGQRLIIPSSLHPFYVNQLHQGHPGAEATKRRAREIVYWPNMNEDIDNAIKLCSPCNSNKAHQQKEPLLLHPVPDLPWTVVASDLFEWNTIHYMVLVDSYSGWFEFDTLHTLSSGSIIKKLKRHFSVHGIPNKFISDNGTQYASKEFKDFASEWDFCHVTSSPEYPQSNWLAENTVKQAKKLLEKTKNDGSDLFLGLLNLRNTPRDSILGSPAQRLMSRRLRTVIPLPKTQLKPRVKPTAKIRNQLSKKRDQQKVYYDKQAKPLSPLQPEQAIRLQTKKGFNKLGFVQEKSQHPRSYIVNVEGKTYRRNRRHLLAVPETPNISDDSEHQVPDSTQASPTQDIVRDLVKGDQAPVVCNTSGQENEPVVPPVAVVTRSGRVSKPNSKYMDFVK